MWSGVRRRERCFVEAKQRHQEIAIENAKAGAEAASAEASLADLSGKNSADQVASGSPRRASACPGDAVLSEAEANASAFDADALERGIANIGRPKQRLVGSSPNRDVHHPSRRRDRDEAAKELIETRRGEGGGEARERFAPRTEAEADMLKLVLDSSSRPTTTPPRQFLGRSRGRAAAYVGRIVLRVSWLSDELRLDRITRVGSRRKASCSAGGRRNG